MSNSVQELYGNRLRIRSCGVCVQENKILLVNHRSLKSTDFWSPPGGGVNFNESVTDRLVREFEEETGLEITVGEFMFACEFIQPPLHAIEFFFQVLQKGGHLKKGIDPELQYQIIEEVKFVSWAELEKWPQDSLHGIFKKVQKPAAIIDLRGYFKL